MKKAALASVAVAVVALGFVATGSGCAADTGDDAASEQPVTEAPPSAHDGHATDPRGSRSFGPDVMRNDVVVSNVVHMLDGGTYRTGTFVGSMSAGSFSLMSRGEADVFVERTGPDGTVLWAIALGSAEQESSPRVSIANGRVTVIAMTEGHVDCGAGSLPDFPASGTFVVCAFDVADGSVVESGAFPIRS